MKINNKNNAGFTLIELMIVVAIIAIIAAIALPKLMSARISANENAAVATLRSIAAAQQQFQASSSVDTDYDGGGEFGYFGEMAGVTSLRIGSSAGDVSATLDPPYLATPFGNITASLVERQGYNYQIFLPDSTGAGVTEALGALGTSLSPADSSDCEVMWCCYAWPVDAGKTGMRAFFINQEGDIISQNNRVVIGQYSGTAGPAWSAAYADNGGTPDMDSGLGLVDNANAVTANDDKVWTPVGN
jgi:prepilin-type N-terminal cleavage/methylation domain-containing protein